MQELQNRIIEFRNKRNWEQFHTIKDLCLGLNIEVSELQQLFLWKNNDEIQTILDSNKEEIEEELADIFIFLTYLCNATGINLEEATMNKLSKNDKKYPINKSYGSNKKYTKL